MSDEQAEQQRGRRQTVSLARLYLDPNNFRFLDNAGYRPVEPDEVFNADVQRRTTSFILGRSQEQVRDLIDSIRENGWLDIDPILVKAPNKGRYVVIEGNRRIATLKHLQRRHEEESIDLGKLDPALFSRMPVVIHDVDERQNMVMMGLHHISGKRRWPAINRALAMKRLLAQSDGDVNTVCRALGVTKQEFNRSIRALETLALIDAYKESDYGDQFRSRQYTLFRGMLNSPAIRRWLGWDDTASVATEPNNQARLFNWMSSIDRDDRDDEGEKRISADIGPVITTLGHVYELEKLIENPNALERLDETRSLQEATLSSDLFTKAEVNRAFIACDAGIRRLSRQVGDLDSEDLDVVEHLIDKLHGIAVAHKRRPAMSGDRLPWQPFNEWPQSQFSSVEIREYRGINGLALKDLRRINLIAGVNNAGKTSLLEAIHLLAHQNDEMALLGAVLWRGRLEEDPDPKWLAAQIQPHIHIAGSFDGVPDNTASLTIQRENEPGDDIKDQTSFLTRLVIESRYGGQVQSTDAAFFSDRPHQTRFEGRRWLCRSALTSAFASSRMNALVKANEAALKASTKAKVIDFIKEHIDSSIVNIELVDERDGFRVIHQNLQPPSDLSSFGDGLRRVFEIGLLFATVRGGVLLIDEFESAIHPQLLTAFTRIVQELAAQHNVQVFLTTHSKEALDAFIVNNYKTDGIACYAIRRGEEGTGIRRFDGEKLLLLHEAADFDVRGIQ